MKINVTSALGNPKSKSTWSGTPFNIIQELENKGIKGEVFESSKNNILFTSISFLLRLSYRLFWLNNKSNSLPFIFKFKRILNGISSIAYLRKFSSNNIIHFGTLSVPLLNHKGLRNQNHYLYIDGTWDLWSKCATDLNGFSSADIIFINELEKKAYKNIKHIFSVSEYVKQNLVEKYKISATNITVVGTGTGIIKPYFGTKDYTNGKILFVAKGRFEDKGGDLVLEAFLKTIQVLPNLQLSIVGQKNYSSIISHPNIKTYGFLEINDLQELFNIHSLFLMPALNEPWGLVYIEAMLCKMPIVGLNRNSFPELSGYGKYGFGIDFPDSNALSELILDLMNNPFKLEETGILAQKRALSEFTWEATVQKISNEINKQK